MISPTVFRPRPHDMYLVSGTLELGRFLITFFTLFHQTLWQITGEFSKSASLVSQHDKETLGALKVPPRHSRPKLILVVVISSIVRRAMVNLSHPIT